MSETSVKKRKASTEDEGPLLTDHRKESGDYEKEKEKRKKRTRKSLNKEAVGTFVIETPVAGSSKKSKVLRPPEDSDDEDLEDREDSSTSLPFTLTPTPAPKPEKGKNRDPSPPPPEEQMAGEEPVEESDDDDIQFNFKVLGINTEATGGTSEPGRSFKLVTTFSSEPYACFDDHMAPFRGIIAEHKSNPDAAGVEISDMFRKNTKRKLLVATTGWEFTNDSKRVLSFAIETITGQRPKEIEPVRRSAWAVITMNDKANVQKLLNQKVAFDPLKKMLISFRKPTSIPSEKRSFEVRNVQANSELVSLRKWLIEEQKVVILSEHPPKGEWTTVYDKRIIWKVKVLDPQWERPGQVIAGNGNRLYLANPPTCDTCHSDDHHFMDCPWKTILPGVKFRQNSRKK